MEDTTDGELMRARMRYLGVRAHVKLLITKDVNTLENSICGYVNGLFRTRSAAACHKKACR